MNVALEFSQLCIYVSCGNILLHPKKFLLIVIRINSILFVLPIFVKYLIKKIYRLEYLKNYTEQHQQNWISFTFVDFLTY